MSSPNQRVGGDDGKWAEIGQIVRPFAERGCCFGMGPYGVEMRERSGSLRFKRHGEPLGVLLDVEIPSVRSCGIWRTTSVWLRTAGAIPPLLGVTGI